MNKILEVFTKRYREETKYQIFMEKHRDLFKLNGDSFNVDESIDRLRKINFHSDFHVDINYDNQEKVLKKGIQKCKKY